MKGTGDQDASAAFIESEKNFRAGMTGCLGAGIGIGVAFYVVFKFILPHVSGWFGFIAIGVALIGPQVAAARWHDKQVERNLLERIRSEREQRIKGEQ